MELLGVWLTAAREAGEPLPHAMTLATVAPDGWPSARMVMLRGLDRGVTFFTDSRSEKGAELATAPRAAAVLHWLAPQHRQVRIVGEVERVGAAEAERYWRSRPPEVRRTAAASVQSQVIVSRAELEERLNDLAGRYPDGVPLPRPDRWTGYRILPATIEFWQESPDRLHDRFRYRRVPGSWDVERLSP